MTPTVETASSDRQQCFACTSFPLVYSQNGKFVVWFLTRMKTLATLSANGLWTFFSLSPEVAVVINGWSTRTIFTPFSLLFSPPPLLRRRQLVSFETDVATSVEADGTLFVDGMLSKWNGNRRNRGADFFIFLFFIFKLQKCLGGVHATYPLVHGTGSRGKNR